MDELPEALRSAMARWPVRQRYLIGVSGGVDSVVLLHSLHRTGYRKLTVCHLDHGLRGKVSAADRDPRKLLTAFSIDAKRTSAPTPGRWRCVKKTRVYSSAAPPAEA